MKPNIFDISTKELSQDAFITWLLKWADNSFAEVDIELCNCGKYFISQLIKKAIPDFGELITQVEAVRQWKNIDIWVRVNNKYLIVIEDKTYSSQHSGQLARYKNIAEEWCAKQLPQFQSPICIYIKTGNESQQSLISVQKNGFKIFNRLDFIAVLNEHDIKNDIYNDFKSRINRIEKNNTLWEEKVIKDWDGNDWQGFFQFLENDLGVKGWNFVNNQSGGFWNSVLNWDYWGIYPVYLQTEQYKLCFKISTDPKEPVIMPVNETRASVRNRASRMILNSAKENNINHVKRPSRFGNGKYMTLAVVNCENWMGNNELRINKEEVLYNLKLYKKFLLETIKN